MVDCVSVLNMRLSDRQTIEGGISGIELIWRAANAVFRAIEWRGTIAIVTGSGNNGADGFALAQILHCSGFQTTVIKVSNRLHDDCLYYALEAEKTGVSVLEYKHGCSMLEGYDIIVDCMLGTGFTGSVRDIYREAIDEINRSEAYVVSIDINSGMDGDTGEGTAVVKSDVTVAIEFVKKGMITESAGRYIGKLLIVNIGIQIAEREDYICNNLEWLEICKRFDDSDVLNHVIFNDSIYHKCPNWLIL